MSDSDPTDPLAEMGKEIVPKVYEDALQASAKEVGHALHGVTRIALGPINATVWTIEQAYSWIERAVKERLDSRRLPLERMVAPKPQIVAGVVQGVWATGPDPDPDLREMYANLLTTAIDMETAKFAHPAFAEILQQMLSDEARVIKLLELRGGRALVDVSAEAWRYTGQGLVALGHREIEKFERSIASLCHEAECAQPEMVDSYVDNLKRLGLVTDGHTGFEGHLKNFSVDPSPETELRNWLESYGHTAISDLVEDFSSFRDHRAEMWKLGVRFISFTSFGQQFVKACSAG